MALTVDSKCWKRQQQQKHVAQVEIQIQRRIDKLSHINDEYQYVS